MKPLKDPPLDAEFVPLSEYQSSTPASFALSDAPILYHKTSGVFSGLLDGHGQIWIGSDGIHIWLENKGSFISYNEVILHAIQKDPSSLYVQLQLSDDEVSFHELTVVPDGTDIVQLYEAITACIELRPYSASQSDSGDLEDEFAEFSDEASLDEFTAPADTSAFDLESGQGDDEIWDPVLDSSKSKAAAAVQLHNGVLGKRNTRSHD